MNISLAWFMHKAIKSLGYKFVKGTREEIIAQRVKSYILTFVPIINIIIFIGMLIIPLEDFIESMLDNNILEYKYDKR
jgi:hypothetical protein